MTEFIIRCKYMTGPDIPKSEVADCYTAALGWFGLAWPIFDTWCKPEAKDLGNQRYRSYKAFGIFLDQKRALLVTNRHSQKVGSRHLPYAKS